MNKILNENSDTDEGAEEGTEENGTTQPSIGFAAGLMMKALNFSFLTFSIYFQFFISNNSISNEANIF